MKPTQTNPEHDLNAAWLGDLDTPKIRALASQHGLKDWNTAPVRVLRVALMQLPEISQKREA